MATLAGGDQAGPAKPFAVGWYEPEAHFGIASGVSGQRDGRGFGRTHSHHFGQEEAGNARQVFCRPHLQNEKRVGSVPSWGMSYPSSVPHYFDVTRPWHFRARPDFAEEICLVDAAESSLPRTPETFSLWRKATPGSSELKGYAAFRTALAGGYQPSRRLILQPIVLDGEESTTGAVVDARGWWIPVPFEGLYLSIFHRAAELMSLKGYDFEGFSRLLDPMLSPKSREGWRVAPVCIGYERDTGSCSLLASDREESKDAFMLGGSWREVRLEKKSSAE